MNTLLDLFAGCGGLSSGLVKAGIKVKWANEIDPAAAETYAANHPGTKLFKCDAKKLFSDVLSGSVRGLKKGNIDILSGGPPCQGFCEINRHRSIEDPRNSCVELFYDFVDLLRPRVVLMENVTGILTLANGHAISSLIKSLGGIGYSTSLSIVQCGSYGLPQNRWRVFLIGVKNGAAFNFPKPTHKFHKTVFSGMSKWQVSLIQSTQDFNDLFSQGLAPSTTVSDAICDLSCVPEANVDLPSKYIAPPSSAYSLNLRNIENDFTFDHAANRVEEITLERFSYIPAGGGWQNLPYHLQPKNLRSYDSTSFASRYGRLSWSNTFTAIVTKPEPYWGRFIHPVGNRLLTVRECARAQSFPDSYRFSGSMSSRYRQIGNAVPPLIAQIIGTRIVDLIN